jgi:transcriptional regulator with PAS, ATPase and Fis domain
MPLQLQPKLLRVLEDGKVRRLGGKQEFEFDVRVIAATNQEPRTAIHEGRIREDLYYRLTGLYGSLAAAPRSQRRYPAAGAAFHRRIQ